MIALERKTLWIGGLSTVDIKAEEGGSKVVGVLHAETMLHLGTLHRLPNEHINQLFLSNDDTSPYLCNALSSTHWFLKCYLT